MYERFTDRARKIVQLAHEEAKHLGHEYIGTEHILLGLIAEGHGVAAHVLRDLDVDLDSVRRELERVIIRGPGVFAIGKLPFTPRAKKVIEYALVECQKLGHNYVGTEHLLLGLLREREGLGPQVLMTLGLTLDRVREGVLDILGHGIQRCEREARFGFAVQQTPGNRMWTKLASFFGIRTQATHKFDP